MGRLCQSGMWETSARLAVFHMKELALTIAGLTVLVLVTTLFASRLFGWKRPPGAAVKPVLSPRSLARIRVEAMKAQADTN
jgi:hypothetical protein